MTFDTHKQQNLLHRVSILISKETSWHEYLTSSNSNTTKYLLKSGWSDFVKDKFLKTRIIYVFEKIKKPGIAI